MVRKLRSGDVDMGIVGYDMVREYGKVSISNFMCKHFEDSVFFSHPGKISVPSLEQALQFV